MADLKDFPEKLREEIEAYIKEKNLSGKKKDELIEKVTSLYDKIIYDPFEPVGVVTAQSLSEPATQMSLDFNEEVIVKQNNEIKPVKIGQFINELMRNLNIESVVKSEVSDIPSNLNIEVPSLDENGKIKWKRLLAISRHKSPKKLIKITTRSRRTIIATDAHSFVVKRNNKIVPISGKDLDLGERLPVVKTLPVELKKIVDQDVIWDEITDISYVSPSNEYVYDFSVEGLETFTTFKGIITHNTMRTYHFAGTAGIQVTLGLPRMLEIFDARKEPRTPTMSVYLKPGQEVEDVRRIAGNIKEVKIKDVVLSTVIDLAEITLRCKLDIDKLKDLELNPEDIVKKIKIRNVKASVDGEDIIITPKKTELKNMTKLKQSILETHIKGIKGITQVVVSKDDGEWVINTLGSNLKKVFELEGVDYTRTFSNNIFEILDVLGVEAARNAIINQAKYTMEEQGLGIDIRYIMLLADLMTLSGSVRAIGRYGIAGQKSSVLVRASFEETKKHITTAAIKGESDPLRGTVENIIMNQVAPIGTGAFSLVGRIPCQKKEKKEKKAKKKGRRSRIK